ncbi:WD40-repeat-containing domain protein [Pseudomassariella vexata]|uniref:Serine-threonine kinase receptor-associated protein n=1 Tax=Pseudomassariella vexata TaxID=1141098 RepID=A0A1Y2DAK6_9PEZI|nr:WD40-repeat-containing domain protein [Pseudomassariella vexata]ORY55695.1 WD40-repeat-containing domain protein [Pseudomassariella vexata]
MADAPPRAQPLTCHGHSRPVPHIAFSSLTNKDGCEYYLISACKDNNPMLRDGQTGDWIGTFIGHKGAVWQARLSPDASHAATGSADFTAKIWDTHSGECLYTLQHNHIVRAVAYPPDNTNIMATGGYEKKLRIWDVPEKPKLDESGTVETTTIDTNASTVFEICPGEHTAFIKFIVWTRDPNTLVTASGNTLRWFDLPSQSVTRSQVLDGEIGSCEFNASDPSCRSSGDIGDGLPVLAVAAGKCVYFWGVDFPVASVAVDLKGRKYAVGQDTPKTWALVYNWDDDSLIETHKGHHGPVWSIAFAPDNKLYATASEDGTIKLWKNCEGKYGLWHGENGSE